MLHVPLLHCVELLIIFDLIKRHQSKLARHRHASDSFMLRLPYARCQTVLHGCCHANYVPLHVYSTLAGVTGPAVRFSGFPFLSQSYPSFIRLQAVQCSSRCVQVAYVAFGIAVPPDDAERARAAMAEASPTSAELIAVAKHNIVRCYEAMKPFLAVSEKYDHPADRTPEAPAVLNCTYRTIADAKATAPAEFKAYVECLSYYSLHLETAIPKCRAEMKAFEAAFPFKP